MVVLVMPVQQQQRSSLAGWAAAAVAELAQLQGLAALLLMLRRGLAATWQMLTQQMLTQQMLTQQMLMMNQHLPTHQLLMWMRMPGCWSGRAASVWAGRCWLLRRVLVVLWRHIALSSLT
jgi:hypothetical protein